MADRIARTGRPLPAWTASLAVAAGVWLAAAGCSNLPSESLPTSVLLHVEVIYRIPEGDRAPVRLPMSSSSLTVLELDTDPTGLEQTYREDTRLLHVPAGPAVVTVRCRYRIYPAGPDGSVPAASDLFPGATAIRVIDAER